MVKVMPANDEMVEGYRDGLNLDNPKPSSNRSYSYRHGFANGRADRRGVLWANINDLSRMADEAMEMDERIRLGESIG